MRTAPVTLQAQVNTAHTTYSMTLASASVAEAALAELKAGPSAEEIALAEAKVHQAQAQLDLAQAQLTRATLRAPLGGIISSRSIQVGETAQPGVTLMTVTNLDVATLVVYVPQQHLPRVQLGMPVQVYVDVYPDEVFDAQVTFIADQAQFAARDTQAREDRANVVFAVKLSLPNAQRRLKAGMTAEAVIDLQGK
jgi:HlyD family secretion protein